jgi:predicted alpha/beta-hydrolase family hydrolase
VAGWGLLLAPGAGASSTHSALTAIGAEAARLGVTARAFDFPYRAAGRRYPDRPEVLVAAAEAEAAALAGDLGLRPGRIFVGGRSMGGRMCSMAVAGGMPAAGLVLVSYPLHPPGRPDKARTGHFGDLRVPCLFVSGDRDAFGSPEELRGAVSAIPGPVTLRWVEGGDHSLRGRDAVVAGLVGEWLASAARLSSTRPGPGTAAVARTRPRPS